MFFSSYFIHLLRKDKPNHKAAIKVDETLKFEHKLINDVVIMEVMNAVKRNYKINSNELLNKLLSLDEVHFLTEKDYMDANILFNWYGQSINFKDCLILKTMQDYDVRKIVSFDSDFDKVKGLNRFYI